jgi:ribosomal protein S21
MDVKRKPNESTGSLMRRFSRLVQQTKLLRRTKKKMTRQRPITEREEKNRAIMKQELKALRLHLERLGKFSDEEFEEGKKLIKRRLNL